MPQELQQANSTETEKVTALPQSLQYLLEEVSDLADDQREQILEPMTALMAATTSYRTIPGRESQIERYIRECSEEVWNKPKDEEEEDHSLSALFLRAQILDKLTRRAQAPKGSKLQAEAQALLDTASAIYYEPLLQSGLYLPAAKRWSEAHTETPYNNPPTPEEFTDYLDTYAAAQLQDLPEAATNTQISQYLRTKPLADAIDSFGELAEFLSEIDYFPAVDRKGKPQHLFLHQIEAIRDLTDGSARINTYDPGTGKTLMMALATLRHLDTTYKHEEGVKRALIIGSNTVLHTWREELRDHLDPNAFDPVALAPAVQDSGYKRLDERLRVMGRRLASAESGKQLVFANYDLFRHPEFQNILRYFKFHVVTIDEAHNVKSRFIESVDSTAPISTARKVAQRTSKLYQFIRSDDDRTVLLSTGTPFVKDLTEPLIMGHLVSPHDVPLSAITEHRDDPSGTYRVTRPLMVRRRTEEVADLPDQHTSVVPIDMSSMDEDDKEEFIRLAHSLRKDGITPDYFYKMLNLETQLKMPWLVDKVGELIEQGKKVVVFTPFAGSEERITARISTKGIAEQLRKHGILKVAVMDGQIPLEDRQMIQSRFKMAHPQGPDVIAGTYDGAGEAITLCSPDNHATEVIIFAPPYAVDSYIQAIHRVHRIGQPDEVTTHIPYLTNDLLQRSKGTYDERIVKSILRELDQFKRLSEGKFYIEQGNILDSLVKEEMEEIGQDVQLSTARSLNLQQPRIQKRQPRRRRIIEDDGTPRTAPRPLYDIVLDRPDDLESNDLLFSHAQQVAQDPQEAGARASESHISAITHSITEAEQDTYNILLNRIQEYPVLTDEQTKYLFEHLRKGTSKEELMTDPEFTNLFYIEPGTSLYKLFADSASVKDILVNSNLKLIIRIARRYGGLPSLDKFQAGAMGVMRAVDRYSLDEKANFSTYAYYWIQQTITREIADTGFLIRLPVHIQNDYWKFNRFRSKYQAEHGKDPSAEELFEALKDDDKFTMATLDALLNIEKEGITHIASMDKPVGLDTTLGDFLMDPNENIEEAVGITVSNDERRAALNRALSKQNPIHVVMFRMKYGLDTGVPMTLQEVGEHFGISRERVRQIVEKVERRLLQDPTLRHFRTNPGEKIALPRHRREGEVKRTETVRPGLPQTIEGDIDIVERVLAQCSPRDRAMYELYYHQTPVNGVWLTQKEVGERFGIGLDRVNIIFSKIHKKIQALQGEEDPDSELGEQTHERILFQATTAEPPTHDSDASQESSLDDLLQEPEGTQDPRFAEFDEVLHYILHEQEELEEPSQLFPNSPFAAKIVMAMYEGIQNADCRDDVSEDMLKALYESPEEADKRFADDLGDASDLLGQAFGMAIEKKISYDDRISYRFITLPESSEEIPQIYFPRKS